MKDVAIGFLLSLALLSLIALFTRESEAVPCWPPECQIAVIEEVTNDDPH